MEERVKDEIAKSKVLIGINLNRIEWKNICLCHCNWFAIITEYPISWEMLSTEYF